MAKEFTEQTFKETLKALCPIISHLCDMLVAARHAFNRHSVKELEGLAALQKTVTLEIDPFFEKVEIALKDKRQTDQPVLPRLQGVLTHLEIIGSQIGGIADPIRMKTKGGALFSDEDVIFINNLFSKLTGLLRTLVDVFTYQDPLLKKYILDEGRVLKDQCFARAQEHESRMMDDFGHPQAWGIYLAILEQGQLILGHLVDLVKLLDG